MELIEVILSKENLNRAYKKVVANKGASGVDGVTVEELGDYIRENREKIVTSLRNRTYIPKPVRRVYIPKDNGKKRPLGIPTALDRTIQQAIAQPICNCEIGGREEIILDAIRKDSTVTRKQLSELLSCSEQTVLNVLNSLSEKGIIERVSSNRGASWKIK